MYVFVMMEIHIFLYSEIEKLVNTTIYIYK